MRRGVRPLGAVLLAIATLAACAPMGKVRGTALLTTAIPPIAGRPGAAMVSDQAASIVTNNAGSFVGTVRVPIAGVIETYAAGIVSNNGASISLRSGSAIIGSNAGNLIGNNAGGLVANNAAGFAARRRLLATTAQVPLANARIVIADGDGRALVEARTDAEGHFQVPSLPPSGATLIITAIGQVGTRRVEAAALAPAPRTAGERTLALDPASTLVARAWRARRKSAAAEVAPQPALDALVGAVRDALDDQAAVAALLDTDLAARSALQAFAAAEPAVATALGERGLEPLTAEDLPPGTPPTRAADDPVPVASDAPAETPSETPTAAPASSGGGGSGGGAAPTILRDVGDLGAGLRQALGFSLAPWVGRDDPLAEGSADRQGLLLRHVGGLAIDRAGTLYVADAARHVVLRIPASGAATIMAGRDGLTGFGGDEGGGLQAQFASPAGLLRDARTGALIVADQGNGRLRTITPQGWVRTFANVGGSPSGLAGDDAGNVYFTDLVAGLRRVAANGTVSTLVAIANPQALALDAAHGLAWVASGFDVRRVTGVAGGEPALAPTPVWTATGKVVGLAYDQAGTLYAAERPAVGQGLRLHRLAVGADGALRAGQASAVVAGSGLAYEGNADSAAPATTVADGRSVTLASEGTNVLAIDLARAAEAGTAAGQLYLGCNQGTTRAQVVRLEAPAFATP